MRNRDQIKSQDQLKSLCELLEWANASDADDSGRYAGYASQRGFYGHIWNAIHEIILREAAIRSRDLNVIYGGSESWYEDFMTAVDAPKQV